jgi:hypothetical protein
VLRPTASEDSFCTRLNPSVPSLSPTRDAAVGEVVEDVGDGAHTEWPTSTASGTVDRPIGSHYDGGQGHGPFGATSPLYNSWQVTRVGSPGA